MAGISVTLLLVGLLGAAGEEARTARIPSDAHVIAPGNEATIESMLQPPPGGATAGWKLEGAKVDKARIVVTWTGPKGAKGTVVLAHPETAKDARRAGPFAWIPEGPPLPPDVTTALSGKVASDGDGFKWSAPQRSADAPPPAPAGVVVEAYRHGKALDGLLETLRAGADADAQKAVAGIVADPQTHPALLFRVAKWHSERQDEDGAAGVLREVAKRTKASGSKDPKVLWPGAAALLGLGDTAEGAAMARAALAGGLENAGRECGWARRLTVAVGNAEREAFTALLSEMRKAAPQCTVLSTVHAGVLEEVEQYEEAVSILKPLADAAQPDKEALQQLGRVYIRMGRGQEAVSVYRKLCTKEACSARTRGNLLWAQSLFHREADAVKRYRSEADADAANAVRQFEVGVMLHYNKDYDASTTYLARAKAAWPDDPRTLLYLAMNQYRGGEQTDAEAKITEAIKTASDADPDLFWCEAVIYRNADLDRALRAIERYIAATEVGDVPDDKKHHSVKFRDAMREEKARRDKGEAARPFADPEVDFFGEPPGSPGHARNAIRLALPSTDSTLSPEATRHEVAAGQAPGPPAPVATKAPPAPKGGGGGLIWWIIGGVIVLLLGGALLRPKSE